MKHAMKIVAAMSLQVPGAAVAGPQSEFASGVAKSGMCETVAASSVWHWIPCFWLWY